MFIYNLCCNIRLKDARRNLFQIIVSPLSCLTSGLHAVVNTVSALYLSNGLGGIKDLMFCGLADLVTGLGDLVILGDLGAPGVLGVPFSDLDRYKHSSFIQGIS